MTWVAWRQHKFSLFVVIASVAVTAAVMLWFRIAALDHLAAAGIEGCVRVEGDRCPQGAMTAFADAFEGYARNFPMVLLALPVLLGMFTGAPLFARDFEQGTHLLGLTQSISRLRWWAVKVAVVGLPTVAAMFALGMVSKWAFEPLYYVTRGSLLTPAFETQGPVLGAYTALAFALGATAGLLLRNTVGAWHSRWCSTWCSWWASGCPHGRTTPSPRRPRRRRSRETPFPTTRGGWGRCITTSGVPRCRSIPRRAATGIRRRSVWPSRGWRSSGWRFIPPIGSGCSRASRAPFISWWGRRCSWWGCGESSGSREGLAR